MITRRSFIKTSSAAALSAIVLPRMLKAMPARQKTGLQLYTVRDYMAKDIKSTLSEIASIGYKWLEAAGYRDGAFYGLDPKEFASIVKDFGLNLISSHAFFNEEEADKAIDAHLAAGVKYIVFPSFPLAEHKSADDFTKAAERLNKTGEMCKKADLKFGYHNHDFEFATTDIGIGYDVLIANTEPDLVCFQADIYWMKYAGVEPLDYFKNYPGRFELWHVKDMDSSPVRKYTEVGSGIIPYKEIFQYRKTSGMNYFFVEQDDCAIDPLESIAISFRNLQEIINY